MESTESAPATGRGKEDMKEIVKLLVKKEERALGAKSRFWGGELTFTCAHPQQ